MKNNANIDQIIKEDSIHYVNTGHRKKFWFDRDKYMFKYQKANSLESYAEIFIFYLSKACKLNFAHYTLNYYKGSIGVVTQNFLNANEKLISGADLMMDIYKNITDYSDTNIDKMIQKNNIYDISFITEEYAKKHGLTSNISTGDIIKVCIFDIITLQTDRNPFNWGAVVNEKRKVIKLAPIYDNSNIACLNTPEFISNNRNGVSVAEFESFISRYQPLLNLGKKETATEIINHLLENNADEFKRMYYQVKRNYLQVFREMRNELKDNYNETFEAILKSMYKLYFERIDYAIRGR